MFSCWFRQNQVSSTRNQEKVIFAFCYETGKSWEKQVFMLIQTKSGEFFWKSVENYFLHLDKTGKNHHKSWEKHVLMLNQTEAGKFYSKSGESDFCILLWNQEIVRKASFHANSDKIRQILLEIGRKLIFCFFWWNREKSSKIVRKACFHADSIKIRHILLEIGRKLLFAFFDETGKNHQKSWGKHVFMLI